MEQVITSVQAIGFCGMDKTVAVGKMDVADIILDGTTYKAFNSHDELVSEIHPGDYLMHSVGVKAVQHGY